MDDYYDGFDFAYYGTGVEPANPSSEWIEGLRAGNIAASRYNEDVYYSGTGETYGDTSYDDYINGY